MKIADVLKLSKINLAEDIVQNNPGFLVEDIQKIQEMDTSDCWGEPETYDELLAEMDKWDAE